MKTLKEILGEELYAQVQEKLNSEPDHVVIVDNKKAPSFIPKDRFDEVNNQKNEYKTQVGTLNGQLDTLRTELTGNAEALKQVDGLKNQIKDANAKVAGIKIDSELKIALMAMKARKPELVERLIDKSKIQLSEDGTVKGIQEQIDALKTTDAYLFDVEAAPAANPNNDPNNKPNNDPNKGAKDPEPPAGGTGTPGNPSNNKGGQPQSIGARLAAKHADMAKQSAENKFFKTE